MKATKVISTYGNDRKRNARTKRIKHAVLRHVTTVRSQTWTLKVRMCSKSFTLVWLWNSCHDMSRSTLEGSAGNQTLWSEMPMKWKTKPCAKQMQVVALHCDTSRQGRLLIGCWRHGKAGVVAIFVQQQQPVLDRVEWILLDVSRSVKTSSRTSGAQG